MSGYRAFGRVASARAALLPVVALLLFASVQVRAQAIQAPGAVTGNPTLFNAGQRPLQRTLPGEGLALAVSVEGFVSNRWRDARLSPEDAAVASDMALLSRIGFHDNLETLPYGYYGRLSGVEVSIGGRTAVTDAAGKYSIAWIPPGNHAVSLAFGGWKPFGSVGPVQVKNGEVTKADFSLDPNSGTVSGTLRDAVTGQPILHPMINGLPVPTLVWAPENQGVVGYPLDVADHETKRYSLNVFAGSREVKVLAPGYAPFSTRIAVADGQALSRDFRLDPLPASLQGQVYGGEGSTAQVHVGSRMVTTDGSGQYLMENIPPHATQQVRVSRSGFRDTVADTVLVPGEKRFKDFVLAAEGTGVAGLRDVQGRVADIGTGRSLAGVLVIERYNSLVVRACSDAQGRFLLRLDPSRAHNLDFISDGYDPQRVIYMHREEMGQDSLLPVDPRGSYYVNPADPVITLLPNPTYRALAEFGCSSNPPTPGESLDSSIANFPQTLHGTVRDATSHQPIRGVAVELLGNRVCTNSQGEYTVKVAPLGPTVPIVAMSFIRNRYRTEQRSATVANAGAAMMQGYDPAAIHRIDVDMTPDLGSEVYQQGCSPTAAFGSVADDGSGELRQEVRFVVSDAVTGKPVEHAAVAAQPNDRRSGVRLCTGVDGAAVMKDASVALGGTSGVEVNLTVRRNGYRPLEAKLYPTSMETSFLLALVPDAQYQTLDDCTDQRLKIAAANRSGIMIPNAQRQGEVLRADKVPEGVRLQQTANPQVMLPGALAGGQVVGAEVRMSKTGAPLPAPISVASLPKDPAAGEKIDAAGSAAGAFRMKAAPPQIRVPEPDLELSSCRLRGVGNVPPGAELELAAEVRNVSGDTAPPATLRALSSRDERITAEDREEASVKTTTLAAGQGGRWPLRFAAPRNPGDYYFGVCIGQVPGERNGGNNCSKAVTVTVVEPPRRRPEIVVPARGTEKKEPFPASKSPVQIRR
ncbi:MAG: carboxypeptidase regulatory-like domain-containing protein [Candidatus Methylomirabilia bacterium]